MGMQSVQATKEKYVAEILANETYTPESGVVQQLTDQLLRLPKNALGCLRLIVGFKVQAAEQVGIDAKVELMERDSEAWARANPGKVMRAECEERERQLAAGEI